MSQDDVKRLVHATTSGPVCVLIFCVTFMAGLWPFHAPGNDVTWLPNENGLRLGKHDAILSSATFAGSSSKNEACSIELSVTPAANSDTTTLLSFYTPDRPYQFSLQQYDDIFMVRSEGGSRNVKVGIDHVLHQGTPVFITVTLSAKQTTLYVAGALARSFPPILRPGELCTGQLIVGGSAMKPTNWRGKLSGLSIYDAELSAREVMASYRAWTSSGLPEPSEDQRYIARYRFAERTGNLVHNDVPSGPDLSIPARYRLVHQAVLGTPRSEYRSTPGYWSDVAINIVGLIPLGWCFCGYLSRGEQSRRAILLTILIGVTVSLTIETVQTWLPTRSSSMTDLITNTVGTCLGVILQRRFRLLPLFTRRRGSRDVEDLGTICTKV